MTHASLCSGIGSADLAAEWMGWTNLLQVEIDPFCRSVLQKHFPDTPRYTNVKEFDGRPYAGQVDILTAGYPCQPFSTNGKRRGSDDPRHLWPHVLRVIRDIRPDWIVLENVVGHISLGLDNVLADLEAEDYATWPVVLEALSFGARHHRARVFVVAHDLADPDGGRREPCNPNRQGEDTSTTTRVGGEAMRVWSTPAPPLCSGCGMADGLFRGLYPDRSKRLKALGNSIVPQVIHAIFRAIDSLRT